MSRLEATQARCPAGHNIHTQKETQHVP